MQIPQVECMKGKDVGLSLTSILNRSTDNIHGPLKLTGSTHSSFKSATAAKGNKQEYFSLQERQISTWSVSITNRNSLLYKKGKHEYSSLQKRQIFTWSVFTTYYLSTNYFLHNPVILNSYCQHEWHWHNTTKCYGEVNSNVINSENFF